MARARYTSAQAALWTFLIATLMAPALAAVVVFALNAVAGAFSFGPASLKGLTGAGIVSLAAQRALEAYIWSALPAGIAGALAAAWLALRGSLPWLAVVCLAAGTTTIAATLAGGTAQTHLTALAFIAACIGLACWLILRRIRILPPI